MNVIVDCHTHIWETPEQLGRARIEAACHVRRGLLGDNGELPDASPEEHLRCSGPVDRSLVFGFKSRHLGAAIPRALIYGYVRKNPEKLIGVAGIDPTNLEEALEELREADAEFGMKAITVSPAAQDFHPADSRAMQVFSEAVKLKKPVFIHQGIHFAAPSKMEFARPSHLDEVARDLPQLKLVIAHMGYPWIDECIVLLGKHGNVFADVSSLIHRPWQAYNALLSAYEYGVMDKLLFGSDFPYTPPAKAIESLYRINQLVTGTNLPTIPRQFLAAIVERDTLGVLGIAPAVHGNGSESNGKVLDEDA